MHGNLSVLVRKVGKSPLLFNPSTPDLIRGAIKSLTVRLDIEQVPLNPAEKRTVHRLHASGAEKFPQKARFSAALSLSWGSSTENIVPTVG